MIFTGVVDRMTNITAVLFKTGRNYLRVIRAFKKILCFTITLRTLKRGITANVILSLIIQLLYIVNLSLP